MSKQTIDPEQCRSTASAIEQTIAAIEESWKNASRSSRGLIDSDWRAGAKATYEGHWNTYENAVKALIQDGPEFAKWLKEYANDVDSVDAKYAR
jgi:uncharacterized protein YukE